VKRRRAERRRVQSGRQGVEDALRVERQEASVVANESADERAAGQAREVVAFERAHLPQRQLELLRHRFD
jgi:hypothetical protein